MYNEKRALAGKPNNTTSSAHAEIGALFQSYESNNRGGKAILTIYGQDACSFCQSDLKKMALKLELDSLEVHQPTGIVSFNEPKDFKPTKKGGLRWPK
ncbi:cytidine deaminase-like fold-containing protein [Vibrio quintilis]|uniref:cytidine deaminase-like fold-containing protein n=1 Tax=Vibrio quintilis TaxID=1117707 RepID=UPI003F973F40